MVRSPKFDALWAGLAQSDFRNTFAKHSKRPVRSILGGGWFLIEDNVCVYSPNKTSQA